MKFVNWPLWLVTQMHILIADPSPPIMVPPPPLPILWCCACPTSPYLCCQPKKFVLHLLYHITWCQDHVMLAPWADHILSFLMFHMKGRLVMAPSKEKANVYLSHVYMCAHIPQVYIKSHGPSITYSGQPSVECIIKYEMEQIKQVKMKNAGKVPPQLPRYVLLPSFAWGYINVTPLFNLQKKTLYLLIGWTIQLHKSPSHWSDKHFQMQCNCASALLSIPLLYLHFSQLNDIMPQWQCPLTFVFMCKQSFCILSVLLPCVSALLSIPSLYLHFL